MARNGASGKVYYMRILIADDESIIRLGLKSMLQQLDHEVVAARDGREALQMARAQRPDLAILDVKMPFTDGLQVARVLARSQPMPIVLLTAYSDQALIDQAADLPIHGYLVKPVQAADLAPAMAIAVRRFADAEQLRQRAAALEAELQARKLIDRAKGVLMNAGMNESTAYHAIQRRAREQGRTMRQIAEAILRDAA